LQVHKKVDQVGKLLDYETLLYIILFILFFSDLNLLIFRFIIYII
jgi:hypothetical protein